VNPIDSPSLSIDSPSQTADLLDRSARGGAGARHIRFSPLARTNEGMSGLIAMRVIRSLFSETKSFSVSVVQYAQSLRCRIQLLISRLFGNSC
jgi:hypothetical protein